MNKGKYVRSFTCWNQMLCMIFGQLTGRDSMRELMLCLEANKKKFYHLGFGTTVTRRNFGVDGNVYAFDSSTIDLCLSIFWWAKFRENKGGIKLHTLFDVKTSIPVLVVDKGYIDFG